jgi:serine/threonine protein phosphatase 1
MKTLIVGDVHACAAELRDLIREARLRRGDELIGLGDLVDRGPDPRGVLKVFRTRPNTRSIMGNHERKNLRWQLSEKNPVSNSQRITRAQLGESEYAAACQWFASLPLVIELEQVVLVHGFVLPDVPLAEQRDTVLLGTMQGTKLVQEACGDTPWYELYRGAKPVVVGHLDYWGDDQPLLFGVAVEPESMGSTLAAAKAGPSRGSCSPTSR